MLDSDDRTSWCDCERRFCVDSETWFVDIISFRGFSHTCPPVCLNCLLSTTAVPSIVKYVITPELYTTKYRAVGLGSASVWTRIGSECATLATKPAMR